MEAELNQSGVIWSWIAVLRRRWRSGLAVFVVMLTLAALMVLNARPVYRADAKLRIGEPPPSPGVSATGTSVLGFMRLGGDPFANDLELLGSRTVTEAIVRDNALTASVIAPRGWHRDSLFSVFTTSDSTVKALFQATWLADGRIRVEQQAPRKRELGVVRVAEPIALGGVTVAFRARKPRGPEQIRIKTMQFGEAAQLTKARVKVARKRRDANVAEIIYASTDPAVTRNVVATAANRFIELRSRIAGRESSQNVDSLRTVARQTLAELQRAEDDLARMQRAAQLVDPTAQNKVFVEQYSAVNQELETARAELQAMDSVLQRAAGATTTSERWTRLLAHPSFLENPTIAQLLVQLTGLEAKRAELAPRRTENNLEFRLVLDQIEYISGSLAAVASGVQKTLAEKVTLLEQQVQRMDAALAALPRNTIELARRQRSARVLSEVLVLTEQRLRQEELRQALSFANVQIIDPAALRFKPVWPRKKLGLAVGGLLAVVFGVLAMAVAE
ncbi:MAG TPA: GNVR domain-containing protein, partial [Longimicrobiales bacterium]|nr:GNVR domain-containing protein [Longimicrobiales bacterium]